jgi:hypothetical protein
MTIDWRHRLWLWGHQAGSHTTTRDLFGIDGHSHVTPAEAARYLEIPNVIMVRFAGLPAPPYQPHALALSDVDRVLWSVVGDAGTLDGADEAHLVADLAARHPHIVGVVMDDFFQRPDTSGQRRLAAHTPEELASMKRDMAQRAGRPLDLWVVVYGHQLELPIADHLSQCDGITLWSWTAEELAQTPERLGRLRELAPHTPILLGCYMWDYGNKREMPLDAMRAQCEAGAALVETGQVEGLIFLASCICDLNLPAVEWTRRWIRNLP